MRQDGRTLPQHELALHFWNYCISAYHDDLRQPAIFFLIDNMYLRAVYTVDWERLVINWYLVRGLQLNLIMVHWPNLTDKTFSTYIHYTYQTLESCDSSFLSKPQINTGLFFVFLFFLKSWLTYFWIITNENLASYIVPINNWEFKTVPIWNR